MSDKRVLYTFKDQIYTISDVEEIYEICKEKIKDHRNDLKKLYEIFEIKPNHKGVLSVSEITGNIAECISIISQTIDGFQDEVVKARRKFLYWGNLKLELYALNEQFTQTPSKRRLKDCVERNRVLTDQLIAYASYLSILDGRNVGEQIEDESLFLHKLDHEYVAVLRFFSNSYIVDADLKIDLVGIFKEIYQDIINYGALDFYKRLYQVLSRSYNKNEKKVVINNDFNTALPTLFHFSLKAMTAKSNQDFTGNKPSFQSILEKTGKAVVLLDIDNEHDLNFLLPHRNNGYLENLMNYSAVYDIHQYSVEGMLFLIKRILEAFSDSIEEAYQLPSEQVYLLLSKIITSSMEDFANGRLSTVNTKAYKPEELNVVEQMSVSTSLNKEYTQPLQWDKVKDDSEWIIKEKDGYYVLPPVISMLGVYDKIGSALKWMDFGPQIEQAVQDLFISIPGLEVYSGKYIFENEMCECDAVVLGTRYALIIESKRKGITRIARGGDKSDIIKDIAESYFSSQYQAYRMHRAVIKNNGMISFYPSWCDISVKASHNEQFEKYRKDVDFRSIERFIRISCTGGNFWIVSEGGIADNIERQIDTFAIDEKSKEYIDKFKSERDGVLKLYGYDKKAVRLNRLFLSFDKLYDAVTKFKQMDFNGDNLLECIWLLARNQSKKVNTPDNIDFFANLISNTICQKERETKNEQRGHNNQRVGIPVSRLILKQYYKDYLTYIFDISMDNREMLIDFGIDRIREDYQYYVYKNLCFEEITGASETRRKACTTMDAAKELIQDEIDDGEELIKEIVETANARLITVKHLNPPSLFCTEILSCFGDYIEGSAFEEHVKIALESFKTVKIKEITDEQMRDPVYADVMNDIDLMRAYVEMLEK